MAVATKTQTAQQEKLVVKVSRKFVAMLDELKDVRATYNEADKRIAELRKDIFAEVGEQAQTLTHNGVEVAVIVAQTKEVVDMELLKTNYPEAYQACLVSRTQYPIRAVSRKK
jgi:hypothetical protein